MQQLSDGQKMTEALFVIEYESNLCVKASLQGKRHFWDLL